MNPFHGAARCLRFNLSFFSFLVAILIVLFVATVYHQDQLSQVVFVPFRLNDMVSEYTFSRDPTNFLDYANHSVPLDPIGDYANHSVPVDPIGDYANHSVPVDPIGDYANHSVPVDLTDSSNSSNDADTAPLILIWTTYFSHRWVAASSMFNGCPANLNCVTTFDRRRVNDSAAIVFHIPDFRLPDIPRDRYPSQYYVFLLWESPVHTGIDLQSRELRHFFNLTVTYRLDSDGYWPYGIFRGSAAPNTVVATVGAGDTTVSSAGDTTVSGAGDPSPVAVNVGKIVNNKSRLIAWFVSKCNTPSRREKFVAELKKFIPVDIYGSCGSLKCERRHGQPDDPCADMLTKKYKFYLSLENSLCRDYITEKFYRTMSRSVVVPVVMERKLIMDTITDDAIAQVINKSIIAVDDFQSVTALVHYLKYLDTNTTAYIEYLHWRHSLEVSESDRPQCDLCRLVKERKQHQIDIADWWIDKGGCHSWRRPDDGGYIHGT